MPVLKGFISCYFHVLILLRIKYTVNRSLVSKMKNFPNLSKPYNLYKIEISLEKNLKESNFEIFSITWRLNEYYSMKNYKQILRNIWSHYFYEKSQWHCTSNSIQTSNNGATASCPSFSLLLFVVFSTCHLSIFLWEV